MDIINKINLAKFNKLLGYVFNVFLDYDEAETVFDGSIFI
jgi:hypothetical protein